MKGFDAVFDRECRVLILGSFPSVKSRAQGFYYGNKQNKFWKVLANIFGEKIENEIQSKIDFLLKHHIALFDAVEVADLEGSADSVLKKSNYKLADLSFLLPPRTKVEKIICNGLTAYEFVTKNLQTSLPILYLPSTSPANVSFKIDKWQQELSFLK